MVWEKKRTVCPFDCPDTCSLMVSVEAEKVVKVQGDAGHFFTRGTLCVKMASYEKTVYSPKRLKTPLLRSGSKGEGVFTPVSWEQAMAVIGSHWRKLQQEGREESILPCLSAGNMGLLQKNAGQAFFQRLGAANLVRTICSSAKSRGWEAIMGDSFHTRPSEAADSDLIVLWGTNTLATNVHFLHDIKKAKDRGGKVWLIDVYCQETANLADELFLIRPGTDGALALGMIHVIMRESLADQSFLQEYVQGWKEFQEKSVREWTPERTSEVTGLSSAVIEKMALHYARAKAPFIRLGSGLSRYAYGGMSVRTILCLPAVVGAWKKRGGGAQGDISTAKVFSLKEYIDEKNFSPARATYNINQLGAVLAGENSPVRSLYVYGANPLLSLPDQEKVAEGLSREDLFTVVHDRFMTDTARYADVVLPATTSFEHCDIYRSYGHYGIQKAEKIIDPLGEAKSNRQVFQLLAQEMGYTEAIYSESAEFWLERILAEGSPWLDSADKAGFLLGEGIELPLPENYKLSYQTPSGKIEILNPTEAESLPRFIPSGEGREEYALVIAPSLYTLNSSFNERPELVEYKGRMELKIHPSEGMKLRCSSGQRVLAGNQWGQAEFYLNLTENVPPGLAVAEGVWWLEEAPGERTVNALTGPTLTDLGEGSTFSDNRVWIRLAE